MAAKKSEKAARLAVADMRELTVEDLRGKLVEQRGELMTARLKHAVAQLENTSEIRAMRRQVARLATVLNDKEKRGL
ncbi:MAG: 50S ribosomal protein L29 [Desulfovibrio sp.]|jgi:large subunit ribosomal protein L29|nr:50S ribosomal protein L29 [Desulfovibrio sp.]